MGNSLSNDEINARLHSAAEKGDLKDLQKYLKKGGDLNKLLENEEFQKPQTINPEMQSEKGEAFDKLVSSLASDAQDDESSKRTASEAKSIRMNALHRAASRKNNLKILKYILDHVSDVDEQDSHGDTALHYVSMFHNNDESVATLMKFKPNINLQNDKGETALYSAVMRGCDLKIIEWLLKGGADPNICNIDGNTPLHACALRRGIDPLIPGILLRFGANPNLKNRLGQTPLHVAAETTNNAVLLLLKFNAKVRLRDNNGHRPSEVATSEDIRKVLEEEENDLLERTTKTSDIIAKEEVPVMYSAPPGSAQAVQNWLNGQNSMDSSFDFDRNGSIRSEKGRVSQIFYPNGRATVSESGQSLRRSKRMSVDSYYNKFAGGGGDGMILLPDNKEIIIPPDAVPLGTTLKVTIKSNDLNGAVPDLSGCNFKFDIKIQLPGRSLISPMGQNKDDVRLPPVFSGMCLEGDTSWRCMRDVGFEDDNDTCVRFSLNKQKCVPIVKRTSRIEVRAPIRNLVEEDDQLSLSSSTSSQSGKVAVNVVEDHPINSLSDEKFWARQVVVVKEASDTSGSVDGSEADSFAEEDFRRDEEVDEEMYTKYGSCMDELEDSSLRIQHPIDQELATIKEEDGNNQEDAKSENPPPSVQTSDDDHSIIDLKNSNPFIKESCLSLDSGYRGSIEFDD